MGLGRMNQIIEIFENTAEKDAEGFAVTGSTTLATVRAYREGRHGTSSWANRAAFSKATDLFRLRKIPGLDLRPGMQILCAGRVFEITSVEDVKGRRVYIELLAKEVAANG